MSFRISSNLAVCLVVAFSQLPAFAQSVPTGSWAIENVQSGTAYNLSSPYGGFATDGTFLYIFGGYQYGASVSYPQYYQVSRRYDPANNAWITLSFMSYPTYYNAGSYYDGRLYSFGGYNTNQGWVPQWQYYQLSTGTWATGPTNMSSPRYYHSAVEMNGTIYMTAGYNPNSGPVATHEAFNPSTNQFSQLTPLPQYQYYLSLAAVPALGKLYAMGGYGPSGYQGQNYEYTPQDNDPATNDVGGTWVSRANISNGSAQQNMLYLRTVTLSNRVYVCGGQNANTGITQVTLEYNPFSNTWTQRANMNYLHYMHAAVAINNKGYVYGGPNYPTMCEEFTPPNFGSPPNPTVAVQVGATPDSSNQAQADPTIIDGWTNNQVTFTADVTDPDAAQQVRFRVQVKPATASWTQTSQVTSLDTGVGAQGAKALSYSIPAGGGYDWRWRIEDAFANSYPEQPGTWMDAFDNPNSPDFRSDQEAPSDPVALYPSNVDIQVDSPSQGPVLLRWQEATDNAPSVGISYELQVATDGGFQHVEAQIFSPAGTSELPVSLSVSRYDKFWRIRARDIGGNFSEWSDALDFRVTYNDGLDHGAGDARKACGFAAAGGPAIGTALLGAALLALAALRRKTA